MTSDLPLYNLRQGPPRAVEPMMMMMT